MSNFLKLNNLFKDDNEIQLLKQYLSPIAREQMRQLPEDVNPKRFAQKFSKFILRGNDLVYKPLNLVVVPNAEINEVLKEEYASRDVMGKSIMSFHRYLCSKYINIKRKHVKEFLGRSKVYQMTKPQVFRVNKPITSVFPNSLWAIDLIDMKYLSKSNYEYKYIVNVVDVFSRKIWIEPIKFKTAKQISETFEKIIERAGVKPNHLMSDNGTEFQGRFKELCEELGIKKRNVRSYTPQANGIVETANKQVRKLIRFMMTTNNTVRYVGFLKDIEKNRNSTYNSTIKNAPDNVWTPDKEVLEDEVIDENTPQDTINKLVAQQTVKDRFQAKKDKYENVYDNFQVFDLVRIRMATVFTNIRKMIKQTKSDKLIAVKYTPKLFVIVKRTQPRKETLERRRYHLETLKGELVTLPNGNVKPFYGVDLQKVTRQDKEERNITTLRALEINKIKHNKNDLNIGDLSDP